MRMQVILDSSFARPGSAPIWGGKKGEFRNWTSLDQVSHIRLLLETDGLACDPHHLSSLAGQEKGSFIM